MSDKFQQKYRISSARASWWDYSLGATYFVTICTKDRIPYFGEIIDGVVKLSKIGEIVQKCWEEIPTHFSSVLLDEFVVMPNHIHGIVVIDKDNADEDIGASYVETLHATSLQITPIQSIPNFMSKISPKPQSLPTVIRSFKSAVSKSARLIDAGFGWQSRYHDRIVRDQSEHERIVSYILDNPESWLQDELFVY